MIIKGAEWSCVARLPSLPRLRYMLACLMTIFLTTSKSGSSHTYCRSLCMASSSIWENLHSIIHCWCSLSELWYAVKTIKSGVPNIDWPMKGVLPTIVRLSILSDIGIVAKTLESILEISHKMDTWAGRGDRTIRCREHGRKVTLMFK